MASDMWCKTCGGYVSSYSTHQCPPRFQCRFDEKDKSERDWVPIFAANPEVAAEKFADRYDCENEYSILQQGDNCERIIEVRDPSDEITRWNIRAESVPHYYAEAAEED